MKIIGQKLKICAKKARAANKRRVAFLAKIATRWIYFIHIFRQLLVLNLSKSEKKSSVLALGAYYTDYRYSMPSAKQPSNIKHGGGIRPNVWVLTFGPSLYIKKNFGFAVPIYIRGKRILG